MENGVSVPGLTYDSDHDNYNNNMEKIEKKMYEL